MRVALAKKKMPTVRCPRSLEWVPNDGLFQGREESIWNFWRDGVTATLGAKFLECNYQCYLMFVKGLRAREVPISLEFGTAMHWCLEQIYTQFRNSGKKLWTLVEVIGIAARYMDRWRRLNPMPTKSQTAIMEHAIGMAEIILPRYLEVWKSDFDPKIKSVGGVISPAKYLSLEEKFKVMYTYPDGRSVPLQGKRDVKFESAAGIKYIRDTKCLSIIKTSDILATIQYDFQQMLYLTCARAEEEATGMDPKRMTKGITMDIIRRPGQKISKYRTLRDLLEKVRAEVQNAKKVDHYFVRPQALVSQFEIKRWADMVLHPTMRAIREWWEGKRPLSITPAALAGKYGISPYLAPTNGDFRNTYVCPVVFPELED